MPPLLHDIVRDIVAKQPDMELLGNIGDREVSFRSLEETAIDVVIVGAPQPDDSGYARELLQASSPTRVLVIANSGRSAVMYEMRPQEVALGEVSPEDLVAAIRAGSRS